MNAFFLQRRSYISLLVCALLVLVAGLSFSTLHQTNAQAQAQPASLVVHQVSTDPYTNSTSQHQTQVEPDTFSVGSMIVSAFQSGRFYAGGGASGISWATSFDAGLTWKGGILPDITTSNGGVYARVSDAVVAYGPCPLYLAHLFTCRQNNV